ncbi:glycine/D-amino acid oxidase-like deaminating enzyme [Arthrobacter silviterrae]|uniref:FAD-dependent oxidoreductase n=1 Tax=Arthrobacter silviterrae TaxID=2026658 RepID=A0ABX0DGJ7_9MICC|nr:FAD-dependent oxidoreductase [Arthrobacter silviterrae]MDQ0278204.1 glycine/D-amino acid oxidase-like deaminating enzyme [Arthrobacter silviterrae]NGN84891.1 FAD-dependent oxidoreductase [Arthrobacter silviterrae]
MNKATSPIHSTDVVIVGAGITGLAHAAEAVARGLAVCIVERDSRAVGASIRNFGHCCVTAQTGELLELARTAREGWLRHSELAGFFSVESGAVAVARNSQEVAVLEELAATRGGEVSLIGPAAVRAELSGHGGAEILGGAVLRDDIRVDPREAVAKLAAWLGRQPRVRFLWRTSYFGAGPGTGHDAGTGAGHDAGTGAGPGAGAGAGNDAGASSGGAVTVHTSRGPIRAGKVIVCVGHDLDRVHPELAEERQVDRCALQMALVRPPSGLNITRAVLTGTSMLRYPAFAETTAARELKRELAARNPELLAIDANVMLTQRPDGTLIIGDSHRTEATTDPFLSEQTTDTLLTAAAHLLGRGNFQVLQRWQGVYASSPLQSFLVERPAPHVTAVSVTSGIGMTISFGLARKTFDQLESTLATTR